jgi:hypothetical protein
MTLLLFYKVISSVHTIRISYSGINFLIQYSSFSCHWFFHIMKFTFKSFRGDKSPADGMFVSYNCYVAY